MTSAHESLPLHRPQPELEWPSLQYLPSYVQALESGWSPNNVRPEARFDELALIEKDALKFVAGLVDLDATGGDIELPDGSTVPKLPGYRKWLVDPLTKTFLGSYGFRWVNGSNELPPYCLGHIGYAVVESHRGKGLATLGLKMLLQEAPERGLSYVYIHCLPDNIASKRVIEKNGGEYLGIFVTTPGYGSIEELKYRIDLEKKIA
jgi:predicted acetyltransferase